MELSTETLNKIRQQAMIETLAAQRDASQNIVVALRADLAVALAKIENLTKAASEDTPQDNDKIIETANGKAKKTKEQRDAV